MSEEVRYHYLRPEKIIERRTECPIAYIPIGTIEWHGHHMPTGADGIQAEGLAEMCARNGGGLVFPTLYYGENRLESLMETDEDDSSLIAKEMKLSFENFSKDKQPFSATEQSLNYHKLLIHILAEVETLGFEVAILVAGHYPLIDHARAAVLQFNQRSYSRKQGMLAWAFSDYLLLQNEYKFAGDHAARWETSHVMALEPETVDLTTLPPKGEKLIGVMGKVPPQDSTAEFGMETLVAASKIVIKEAKHRLENREKYKGHGWSLEEDRWQSK